METDLVSELHNYLLYHTQGNLGKYLFWTVSERGPDNQKIYYATARFYGHDIGVGSSSSRDGAKNQAAAAALKLLRSTGVEGFIR